MNKSGEELLTLLYNHEGSSSINVITHAGSVKAKVQLENLFTRSDSPVWTSTHDGDGDGDGDATLEFNMRTNCDTTALPSTCIVLFLAYITTLRRFQAKAFFICLVVDLTGKQKGSNEHADESRLMICDKDLFLKIFNTRLNRSQANLLYNTVQRAFHGTNKGIGVKMLFRKTALDSFETCSSFGVMQKMHSCPFLFLNPTLAFLAQEYVDLYTTDGVGKKGEQIVTTRRKDAITMNKKTGHGTLFVDPSRLAAMFKAIGHSWDEKPLDETHMELSEIIGNNLPIVNGGRIGVVLGMPINEEDHVTEESFAHLVCKLVLGDNATSIEWRSKLNDFMNTAGEMKNFFDLSSPLGQPQDDSRVMRCFNYLTNQKLALPRDGVYGDGTLLTKLTSSDIDALYSVYMRSTMVTSELRNAIHNHTLSESTNERLTNFKMMRNEASYFCKHHGINGVSVGDVDMERISQALCLIELLKQCGLLSPEYFKQKLETGNMKRCESKKDLPTCDLGSLGFEKNSVCFALPHVNQGERSRTRPYLVIPRTKSFKDLREFKGNLDAAITAFRIFEVTPRSESNQLANMMQRTTSVVGGGLFIYVVAFMLLSLSSSSLSTETESGGKQNQMGLIFECVGSKLNGFADSRETLFTSTLPQGPTGLHWDSESMNECAKTTAEVLASKLMEDNGSPERLIVGLRYYCCSTLVIGIGAMLTSTCSEGKEKFVMVLDSQSKVNKPRKNVEVYQLMGFPIPCSPTTIDYRPDNKSEYSLVRHQCYFQSLRQEGTMFSRTFSSIYDLINKYDDHIRLDALHGIIKGAKEFLRHSLMLLMMDSSSRHELWMKVSPQETVKGFGDDGEMHPVTDFQPDLTTIVESSMLTHLTMLNTSVRGTSHILLILYAACSGECLIYLFEMILTSLANATAFVRVIFLIAAESIYQILDCWGQGYRSDRERTKVYDTSSIGASTGRGYNILSSSLHKVLDLICGERNDSNIMVELREFEEAGSPSQSKRKVECRRLIEAKEDGAFGKLERSVYVCAKKMCNCIFPTLAQLQRHVQSMGHETQVEGGVDQRRPVLNTTLSGDYFKQLQDDAQLNKQQRACFEAALNGRCIFIMGKAGTGKSHLVKVIVKAFIYRNGWANHDSRKEATVNVVAYTNVAVSVYGAISQTLHGCLGLDANDDYNKVESYLNGVIAAMNGSANISSNNSRLDKTIKNLQQLYAIVIDEIGQAPHFIIELLNQTLQLINKTNEPFGGVQCIIVGQLVQSSPMAGFNSSERELSNYCQWPLVEKHLCNGNFFLSVYLDEVMRTKEALLTKMQDLALHKELSMEDLKILAGIRRSNRMDSSRLKLPPDTNDTTAGGTVQNVLKIDKVVSISSDKNSNYKQYSTPVLELLSKWEEHFSDASSRRKFVIAMYTVTWLFIRWSSVEIYINSVDRVARAVAPEILFLVTASETAEVTDGVIDAKDLRPCPGEEYTANGELRADVCSFIGHGALDVQTHTRGRKTKDGWYYDCPCRISQGKNFDISECTCTHHNNFTEFKGVQSRTWLTPGQPIVIRYGVSGLLVDEFNTVIRDKDGKAEVHRVAKHTRCTLVNLFMVEKGADTSPAPLKPEEFSKMDNNGAYHYTPINAQDICSVIRIDNNLNKDIESEVVYVRVGAIEKQVINPKNYNVRAKLFAQGRSKFSGVITRHGLSFGAQCAMTSASVQGLSIPLLAIHFREFLQMQTYSMKNTNAENESEFRKMYGSSGAGLWYMILTRVTSLGGLCLLGVFNKGGKLNSLGSNIVDAEKVLDWFNSVNPSLLEHELKFRSVAKASFNKSRVICVTDMVTLALFGHLAETKCISKFIEHKREISYEVKETADSLRIMKGLVFDFLEIIGECYIPRTTCLEIKIDCAILVELARISNNAVEIDGTSLFGSQCAYLMEKHAKKLSSFCVEAPIDDSKSHTTVMEALKDLCVAFTPLGLVRGRRNKSHANVIVEYLGNVKKTMEFIEQTDAYIKIESQSMMFALQESLIKEGDEAAQNNTEKGTHAVDDDETSCDKMVVMSPESLNANRSRPRDDVGSGRKSDKRKVGKRQHSRSIERDLFGTDVG